MAKATGGRKSAGSASPFGRRQVVFALPPRPDGVIGVLTHAEPSWLTLLAAGVAGMPLRRARLARAGKQPDGAFARTGNPNPPEPAPPK